MAIIHRLKDPKSSNYIVKTVSTKFAAPLKLISRIIPGINFSDSQCVIVIYPLKTFRYFF
jgi:hypothetical protein